MRKGKNNRNGVTLLEAILAAGLLTMVLGATLMAVLPLTRAQSTLAVETQFYADGQRALGRIVDDLRQAGVGTIDGLAHPHLFCPHNPGGGTVPPGFGFGQFATPPAGAGEAVHEAQLGDPDYGATTHIVFRIPTDLDGNGTPTVAAGADAGAVEWIASDLAYVLVRPDGLDHNELRRYTDYGANEFTVVASHVERVFFERNDGSNAPWDNADLNPNGREVRVTIDFRVRDPASPATPIRVTVQTLVHPRN